MAVTVGHIEPAIDHADEREARIERAGGVRGKRFLGVDGALDTIFASYAQILFHRHRSVGILLFLATMVRPTIGATGAFAVMMALLTARLLQLSPDAVRAGMYGFNALLIGVALGAMYPPTPILLGVVAAGAGVSVLVMAMFQATLGTTLQLPALTLPFLTVVYPLFALLENTSLVMVAEVHGASTGTGPWTGPFALVETYLRSLGAVVFMPEVWAGVGVTAALVVYSRIGFALSVLGFMVAHLLGAWLIPAARPDLGLSASYNAMLTAVAIGGVWFVPRGAAFVWAMVAAAISVGVTVTAVRVVDPILILPFNVTVLLVLSAMRQRVHRRAPTAVDFPLGTPEENLSYDETRRRRFGSPYVVRFSLPFLGRWVCTQGVDGKLTHRGPWRHAFDFEAETSAGLSYRNEGRRLEDFACYRRPVLAAAPGTVVKVVDGVPDNAVGQVNIRDNWGNLVIIQHGLGLYSAVCHLLPGSIRVHEGQMVGRGERLGLTGNSGRSPKPHLHFQLQGTARVGAPTLASGFSDIAQADAGHEQILTYQVPKVGDRLRNLTPDSTHTRALFPLGVTWCFVREEDGDPSGRPRSMRSMRSTRLARPEFLTVDTDVYGHLMLVSDPVKGALYFEQTETMFTVYDYQGPRGTVLGALYGALPRLPLEKRDGLQWSDYLHPRHFAGLLSLWSAAVLAPLGHRGLMMHYRMKRRGAFIEVEGQSRATSGTLTLQTRAVFEDQSGLCRVEYSTGSTRHRFIRKETAPAHAVPPTIPPVVD